MIPLALKKWLAFGSGVGIQVDGTRGAESLHLTAVRVRPGGAKVLGGVTIEDFTKHPAGVWGTECLAALKKSGLGHIAATVILPRQDVIVRQIALPGVSDRDLAGAIGFQLDGLHPYSEDDVITSWVKLPQTASVLIAIVRKDAVERYVTLFAEAGIRIASITCSAAAVYSALRLFGHNPGDLLAYTPGVPSGIEVYGESAAKPILSALFDADMDRAGALASAELRFENLPEMRPLSELLGAEAPLPYAAALYSACPHLGAAPNLLPAGQRQTTSPWAWIPSAALAGSALLLAGGLAAFPRFSDHRYLDQLNAEIAKVQPGAQRAANLDREIAAARNRAAMIDDFRRRSKADMDVLAELTKLLPPPAWLNSLDLNRTQLNLAGETDQAAPLLKLLDASPLFQSSEFSMPPVRIAPAQDRPGGEAFRIRTTREARP